jgi:hypothetical protein
MKKKFTERLNEALELFRDDVSFKEVSAQNRSLFTPVYREGKYEWAKIMDSDGILLGSRKIHNGEGGALDAEPELLVGVIIQSEDSTSQTKPNPLGKASLSHIPNGVWVNIENTRKRVDKLIVAFVLPKGSSPEHRRAFDTARRNVLNAADMMPDAIAIEVSRGISAVNLKDKLAKELRAVLVGKGRPRSKSA